MNILTNFYLLVIFLAIYSHGRSISDWSTNTDPSIIDECLRKSLKRINLGQQTRAEVSDAKNVVCRTQIKNGVNIKITFDLHEQRWECLLYKSVVQTLSIQYEKCDQIQKETVPEEVPQQLQPNNKNIDDEDDDDDEAKIDTLRQDAQNKGAVDKQDNDEDDNDDEAKIDTLRQDAQNKGVVDKQDNVDNINGQERNEDTNRREESLGLGNQQDVERSKDKGNPDVGDIGQNGNSDEEDDEDTLERNRNNKESNLNLDNQQNIKNDEDDRNMENKNMENEEPNDDHNNQPLQKEDTNDRQAPDESEISN